VAAMAAMVAGPKVAMVVVGTAVAAASSHPEAWGMAAAARLQLARVRARRLAPLWELRLREVAASSHQGARAALAAQAAS